MTAATAVLDVEGLRTELSSGRGVIKAVDGVSLSLRRGETLAIVGESGCGKSMTALSIMRLVPEPPGKIVGGSIKLEGRELLTLDEAAMRAVRGNDISMIFQEPMTSLNPVLTIGSQISEAVRLHQDLSKSAAMDKATCIDTIKTAVLEANPEATASTAVAPNGTSNAASAASRTPIPACVIGTAAASFASGQANSHTRKRRCNPQASASTTLKTMKIS